MPYLRNLNLQQIVESINRDKKPKDKFNFSLTVETYERLRKACEDQGIPMSAVVDKVLFNLVEMWEKADKDGDGKGSSSNGIKAEAAGESSED